MRTFELSAESGASSFIEIGYRGENRATMVKFDYAPWTSEYGAGVISLFVKRFGDTAAYPVLLQTADGVASWIVSDTDTNIAGFGRIEYVYTIDAQVVKSAVFAFFVNGDIGQPVSEPPDPYESWLEQLAELGDNVQDNAQAAAASAAAAEEAASHYPQIIDGYWYVWDVDAGEYVNTGVPATGGGGGGGTSNYNDLSNQPQVEGVTLVGNKTAAELGLAKAPLIGQTSDSTAADYVSPAAAIAAVRSGRDVRITYTDSTYGTIVFTEWASGVVYACNASAFVYSASAMAFTLVGDNLFNPGWTFSATEIAKESDIPPVQTVPSPSDATPQALGTAAAGSSADYSRADHVHEKPTYDKSDVGLGNLDNIQQYSASNPPPYPVSSVNGQTGAVSLSIPSSAADVGAVAVAQGVAHAGEFVVVGSDGNITTVTMTAWQGGSY